MFRKGVRQFRFTAAAQILERLRPGLDARAPDDPKELGPQVLHRIAIPLNDMNGAGTRQLECLFKIRPQLDLLPVVATANHAADGNDDDVHEQVLGAVATARVLTLRKCFLMAMCGWPIDSPP